MPSDLPGRIMVIGLNPAWQKTLLFQELHCGEVNRARTVIAQASGKGVNFAWAVHQAGQAATVFQFSGGPTGQALLADLDARDLRHVTVATAGSTRTCTTLVSDTDGRSTELIEPSAPIRPAEFADLRQAVLSRLTEYAGVALCGTFPPGVPPGFYAEVIARGREGAVVLLDACREVRDALAAGPDILKINAAELTELTGNAELTQAAAVCLRSYPIRWLAVTAGAATAHLFGAGRHYRCSLPHLPNVRNAIGAGDCSGGTWLAAIVSGQSAVAPLPGAPGPPRERLAAADFMAEAFRASLACASASCLTPTPATFAADQAAALARQITLEPGFLP